ncbi:TatD family hydrolase [Guyparkeria hydrothermalis]|uniref:amidohydrolase family protein n=1 Tax=Guyparkeria hydrothermalis TaxID=923 RepID=UPI0020203A98|nr:TatD family hydrolase [Guyparkeria hydrothermalis]MCL7745295.1 TatD family hydrolase [Guyparkeria hydrothermalis]
MPIRTTTERSVALALWLAALLFATPVAAQTPLFDAHLHYNAEQRAAIAPDEILATLEANGIEHAVVTSMPPETVQALAQLAPERIVPFLGVYRTRADKERWMHQPDLPERVIDWLEAGDYRGIGELHIFGRDRNSPVLERLVRIAAERDLVLMIHGDLAIIDRIFAIAPTVQVLWAHLGANPDPTILRAALARHPQHLYIDTSVRDARFLDERGDLRPEWRALFLDHPYRFVVGVDTYSTKRWQAYGEVASTIRRWLDQLPVSVARRIGRENARELLLDPLALDYPPGTAR